MTFRMVLKAALVAAVGAACVGSMQGQSAVDGAIGGTVVDATGAAIAGAKISIRSNATNAQQTVVSDGAGFFPRNPSTAVRLYRDRHGGGI